jgi:hypothetical protein
MPAHQARSLHAPIKERETHETRTPSIGLILTLQPEEAALRSDVLCTERFTAGTPISRAPATGPAKDLRSPTPATPR